MNYQISVSVAGFEELRLQVHVEACVVLVPKFQLLGLKN